MILYSIAWFCMVLHSFPTGILQDTYLLYADTSVIFVTFCNTDARQEFEQTSLRTKSSFRAHMQTIHLLLLPALESSYLQNQSVHVQKGLKMHSISFASHIYTNMSDPHISIVFVMHCMSISPFS